MSKRESASEQEREVRGHCHDFFEKKNAKIKRGHRTAASSVLSEKEAEERTLRVQGGGGQAALALVLVSLVK